MFNDFADSIYGGSISEILKLRDETRLIVSPQKQNPNDKT